MPPPLLFPNTAHKLDDTGTSITKPYHKHTDVRWYQPCWPGIQPKQ
ncbi:hypothetical protein [Xylella fastidiosa]|nr:hypothetical protein [Xylella fastidiosa]MCH7234312.1 hypothetical protein [Xylella fastidiosa subsp. multiplex]